MTTFNEKNTAWKTGDYPLFLGQKMALYDSINTAYPRLFELYKLLKSIDWDEQEVNLEKSRLDLTRCNKSTYDIMIKNLAFQWELDSVASRAIAPLLAPFVSNSEYWAMICKQSENEILHSLTYSEIIRQCLSDPQEVFAEVMQNNQVIKRSSKVIEVFDRIQRIGAEYQLGLVKDQKLLRHAIVLTIVALLSLESIEFMASFAATFAIAEQGLFQGIAKLVQKIAQDEQVHMMMDSETVRILSQTGWEEDFRECLPEIQNIIDQVVEQERSWNVYLFSENRSIVGLNQQLLDEWVFWNAQKVYGFLGLKAPFPTVREDPLPWMANWLNIDSMQNAMQEIDGNNYCLNMVSNDLPEEEVLDF